MSPYLVYQAMRYRKYIGSLRAAAWATCPCRFNLDGDESIWIHAVSVGEVLTARALLPELRERYPRLRMFLSTTTMTGQQIARNNLQDVDEVFYFPVRPRLHRQPDAAAGEAAAVHHDGDRDLAEPAARLPARRRQDGARQRPHLVALVSALPPGAAVLPPRARDVDRFCMQSEESARRIIDIGADRRRGRRHRQPEVRLARASRRRRRAADRGRNRVLRYFRISPDRPVVIAASTLKGEEEPVLEAFQRIRARDARTRC